MKSMKAYVLGALVITMSLVIMGMSLTYAYFVNRVVEVNPENQGVDVTSGELSINFATTATISANAAMLINDTDIIDQADYTAFSISLPSDATVGSAKYNLYLTDILMTSNFKSRYLKWALYNNATKVNEGNFADVVLTASGDKFTASNISLKEEVLISKGNTDSYKLYLWLSNDDENNQIELLNGEISAKVGFRAVSN